jgi:hypothetical protein
MDRAKQLKPGEDSFEGRSDLCIRALLYASGFIPEVARDIRETSSDKITPTRPTATSPMSFSKPLR